ncbi:urease accessory protein UreH [Bacillus tianshenii]|nr:urease accessory protein UreH [Bacillus tianshenii]
MEIGFLSVLLFGFILGIKHAIEPDHVIAVSTIASKSKVWWRSSLAGVFWGIGHTLTLLVVGVIVILLKVEISEVVAMSLEFLVGIMLVYLGVTSVISYKGQPHSHEDSKGFSYGKSLFVGFVHGLAGSAAMILLTISTVESLTEVGLYIFIFGLGTIVGMLLFSTVIGLPFVFSIKKGSVNQTLTRLTGVVSAAFGIYFMYNLGINEGLFQLWIQ